MSLAFFVEKLSGLLDLANAPGSRLEQASGQNAEFYESSACTEVGRLNCHGGGVEKGGNRFIVLYGRSVAGQSRMREVHMIILGRCAAWAWSGPWKMVWVPAARFIGLLITHGQQWTLSHPRCQ